MENQIDWPAVVQQAGTFLDAEQAKIVQRFAEQTAPTR
jgi:hypothetical protein